jgi:hypothetical protein
MEEFDQKKFKKKLKKKLAKRTYKTSATSGFYFVGFIGAVIYYISTATGFWEGILGFLKAIVWPAFLVYEALAKLGA